MQLINGRPLSIEWIAEHAPAFLDEQRERIVEPGRFNPKDGGSLEQLHMIHLKVPA